MTRAALRFADHKGPRYTLIVAALLLAAAPAFAQIDLSGTWAGRPYSDSLAYNPGNGPTPVDFMGLPINESGRARALALSYNTQISSNDRICALYSSVYMMLGPQGIRIWAENDPRTGTPLSWNITFGGTLAPITVWMDGRPHPSEHAPHTPEGFTTGVWEDDVLTTLTTHMVPSAVRRNGAPHSDQATMKLRFIRHDDLLTVSARIEDPVYLDGPYHLIKMYELTGGAPIRVGGPPCPGGSEGVPEGTVRHYLPGQNPFVNEMTDLYNIPVAAVLGGAETMYPEYRKRLKDAYVQPDRCKTPNLRAGIVACGGPGTYPRVPR
jgi:hypothetical protein